MLLSKPVRIGIDTGGTFTDYVLVSHSGDISAWKIPTTPDDPSVGIVKGLKEIMKRFSLSPDEIELIVHGTTIGTNAFLENKCPNIGLIVTEGFKDIIEIGRQQRSDLYNLKFQQRYPLSFDRDMICEISERINSKGIIIKELDKNQLNKTISLLRNSNIKNVAVSLLFSFLNPIHEKKIEESLQKEGFNVFSSHQVSPQINEYERAVTTIVNTKVSPVVFEYLSRLERKLKEIGINSSILIMQSNTGMSNINSIKKLGIHTLYSGLAGGVLAAEETIRSIGRSHVVSLDIGGTSTDVSAIIKRPKILRERVFAGFPLVANMADIETIGSGGGSIAKFRDGLLTVGPESQGANPGPACYSLGGDKVTLTDANMHLAYVDPSNFAGNIKIDVNKSRHYLTRLMDEIRTSPFSMEIESIDELALSIRKILNHNISQAIRVVTVQKGLDVRDFSLLAFGGAGPMQAWEIAEELNMKEVIIPPFPGTWSAYGLIASNIKHEQTHSYIELTDSVDITILNDKMRSITEKINKLLEDEGIKKEQRTFRYYLDLRYLGQSDYLTLPIDFPVNHEILNNATEQFHLIHNQNYSWFDRELSVEIVNVTVEGIGYVPKINIAKLNRGKSEPEKSAIKSYRQVNFNGEWIDTPVFTKSKLLANNVLVGPCIIDQLDTTIVIPPNVKGIVNDLGYILLRKGEDFE